MASGAAAAGSRSGVATPMAGRSTRQDGDRAQGVAALTAETSHPPGDGVGAFKSLDGLGPLTGRGLRARCREIETGGQNG